MEAGKEYKAWMEVQTGPVLSHFAFSWQRPLMKTCHVVDTCNFLCDREDQSDTASVKSGFPDPISVSATSACFVVRRNVMEGTNANGVLYGSIAKRPICITLQKRVVGACIEEDAIQAKYPLRCYLQRTRVAEWTCLLC